MTNTDFIRNRLLRGVEKVKQPSITELQATEWSQEFEQFMKNRLILGAIRYGQLGQANKPDFDRLEYIKRKISEYEYSGNLECLVDIANLALCEFVEGKHPLRHFESIGDHNNHCKERK